MENDARLHWIASHIPPLESELRGWLRAHARSSAADTMMSFRRPTRAWTRRAKPVRQPRAYFVVVRHLLAEAPVGRARHGRMGEMEALRILSDEPGPNAGWARGRN
jgi:hypothetical protein